MNADLMGLPRNEVYIRLTTRLTADELSRIDQITNDIVHAAIRQKVENARMAIREIDSDYMSDTDSSTYYIDDTSSSSSGLSSDLLTDGDIDMFTGND